MFNLLIDFSINHSVYKTSKDCEKCNHNIIEPKVLLSYVLFLLSKCSIYYNARQRKTANSHIWKPGTIKLFKKWHNRLIAYQTRILKCTAVFTLPHRSVKSPPQLLQVNQHWPVKPPSAMLNIKRGRSMGGFPLPLGTSSLTALTSFPASFSPLTSSVTEKDGKGII